MMERAEIFAITADLKLFVVRAAHNELMARACPKAGALYSQSLFQRAAAASPPSYDAESSDPGLVQARGHTPFVWIACGRRSGPHGWRTWG